jgi:hypothetical protein
VPLQFRAIPDLVITLPVPLVIPTVDRRRKNAA